MVCTLFNITLDNVWSVGWQRIGGRQEGSQEAFTLVQVSQPLDVSDNGDEWFKTYLELPFAKLAKGDEKKGGTQNDSRVPGLFPWW